MEEKKITISAKDIAIIGMSCRFPGADSPEEFWKIVRGGKTRITEIPPDRWDGDQFHDPDPARAADGKTYGKWGGFLNDVYAFDPLLFHISPRDAVTMDPGMRLILQTAWATLENAGCNPLHPSPRNVGVFMGVTAHTYNALIAEERLKGNLVSAGVNTAAIANRVSHFFNFTGPSVPIDTECSSSLTAMHFACKSIKNGDCDMALAGGVNLYLHPSRYVALAQVGTLSRDGKTRSFGKGGTGFAPGEGVGAVLLKPLPEAVRDGDYIHGVIKGSAINNWGKSSMYLSPNPSAQADLIIRALKDADVHPETISYIEAQGMGSDIADVSEIASLSKAYGHFTREKQFCALGAVKPNIGHAEAASGMAQLTKVLLQLKHKKLAPTLYSDEPNPNIDFSNSPFYLQHEPTGWDRPVKDNNGRMTTHPRRAGVSSFGAGGTGAHIIVEEFESPVFAPENPGKVIIPLSAANGERLKAYARNLAAFLKEPSSASRGALVRIAHTLQTGRAAMGERLAIVASGMDPLIETLENYCRDVPGIEHLHTGNAKSGNRRTPPAPDREEDDLSKLARRWVAGSETDWLALHPDGAPTRVPAPSYPFATEHYRIEPTGVEAPTPGGVEGPVLPLSPTSFTSSGKGAREGARGVILAERLESDLKSHISDILQISFDLLDSDVNLADFGFDSVKFTEFASKLNHTYETSIPPSIFFDHATVEMLVRYFLEEHKEVVGNYYKEPGGETARRESVPAPAPVLKPGKRHAPVFSARAAEEAFAEPIAIIGMSGRFPGARNIDEMWQILEQGKEAITEVPMERFDWRRYYGASAGGSEKIASNRCGVAPGAGEFDPLFFEISPKAAEGMDPRQRLLLQESWNALEDAGCGASWIKKNRMGIFVGVESGDYHLLSGGAKSITSNHEGILASRLAYFLNFNGPAMAINTACSSSLVAAHQAYRSLVSGECDAAIVGGVNLLLTPGPFIAMSGAGMLSPTGRCYAFDRRADGMVPGEAVVAVVLKRLSDAQRDKDSIYAVIKGSGINYDGKTNGITAPSGRAQAALLTSVYDRYGIDPGKINYIVTHGTGTKLGDPVEINALNRVYKKYTDKREYCALTSTKTNFGHTLAASGLVSLVALALALRHETIPASLNCEQKNDYIDWEQSPFYVNGSTRPWKGVDGENRLGALSGFGMTGSNVHMVLQSRPDATIETDPDPAPFHPLTFSAKSNHALEQKIEDMLTFLRSKDVKTRDLARISLTLSEGRHHFKRRVAIVARDNDDAIHVLNQLNNKETSPQAIHGEVPRNFVERSAIRAAVENLLEQAGSARSDRDNYRDMLFALAEYYCQGYEISSGRLYNADAAPTIHLPTYPFARERYWIPDPPDAPPAPPSIPQSAIRNPRSEHPLIGRNTSTLYEQKFTTRFTGEEFFLKDHENILTAMTHIEMARAAGEIAEGIGEGIKGEREIYKIKNVTWSDLVQLENGPLEVRINLYPVNDEVEYRISRLDDVNQRVDCSQGVLHYRDKNDSIPPGSERIDIESIKKSRTGVKSHEALYGEGMKRRFGPGFMCIEELFFNENEALARIESPGPRHGAPDDFGLFIHAMDAALQAGVFGLHPGVLDGRPAIEVIEKGETGFPFSIGEIEIIQYPPPGRCYAHATRVRGVKNRTFHIRIADLSGAVFARIHNFVERSASPAVSAPAARPGVSHRIPDAHPLLHREASTSRGRTFTTHLTGDEFYLKDHVVAGKKFLPGVAYLEMARAGVERSGVERSGVERAMGVPGGKRPRMVFKNVVWARPIALEEDPLDARLDLFSKEDGGTAYRISTRNSPGAGGESAGPLVHGQGSVYIADRPGEAPRLDIPALKAECRQKQVSRDECYQAFASVGMAYGPGLMAIETIHVGEGRVLAKLSLPSLAPGARDPFVLHPGLMDSALQASIGLFVESDRRELVLPYALRRLEIYGPCAASMWAHVRHGGENVAEDRVKKVDIDVCAEDGEVRARMRGLAARVFQSRDIGTLMATPAWREKAVDIDPDAVAPGYDNHIVMLCEADKSLETNIMEAMKGVRCVTLRSGKKDIDARFQDHASGVFEEIKNILDAKPRGKTLIQLVISNEDENGLFSGAAWTVPITTFFSVKAFSGQT